MGLGYPTSLVSENGTPHSGGRGVFKSQVSYLVLCCLLTLILINKVWVIMFITQEKIFNKAVQIVCDECRITPQELRFGRNRASADARFILVRVISPYICDNEIAGKIQRTRQGVCFIRNKRADKSIIASIQQVESKLISWIDSEL